MATSPTQRAKKDLKDMGYECQVVERWNAFARIRQDLFGFIDILALHPEREKPLAIQVTAGSSHAARRAKILALPIARMVVRGMDVEVWSYAKQGARGKRKQWTLRRERIAAEDFGTI